MSHPPRYGVMGNPVKHSLSPRIHTRFGKQCGIDLEYRAIAVDIGEFARAVDDFGAAGGRGLNVTVPFKLEAWELATRRSPRADLAGAVNTLSFRADGLDGDNTDGVGLLRDITGNLATAVSGARILVIGAGGAVRGVLGPLLEAGPAAVHLANRTAIKAHDLAASFHTLGPCSGSGLDDIPGAAFDIVINGTAASLGGQVPALPDGLFAAGALAYDMMYGREPTAFMRWAETQGAARLSDGLGMLVEQAAESFHVWHGVHPETATVLEELRRELGRTPA